MQGQAWRTGVSECASVRVAAGRFSGPAFSSTQGKIAINCKAGKHVLLRLATDRAQTGIERDNMARSGLVMLFVQVQQHCKHQKQCNMGMVIG